MKHAALATDDASLSAIKAGDVVHVLARVVDVHDDGATVDIIGSRSRFRVHPRLCLIAAVEPHREGQVTDVIELLCGSHGRVVADDLMRSRRAAPRAVAG